MFLEVSWDALTLFLDNIQARHRREDPVILSGIVTLR
jgi:hypothetical protein